MLKTFFHFPIILFHKSLLLLLLPLSVLPLLLLVILLAALHYSCCYAAATTTATATNTSSCNLSIILQKHEPYLLCVSWRKHLLHWYLSQLAVTFHDALRFKF